MTEFFLAILLIALALAGVVVRKTYYYVPAHELKRQAANRDEVAKQLYHAVAYGRSLRGLLWLFIGLTSAGGFVLLARSAPIWLSLLVVIGLLWTSFYWLPSSRATKFGIRLTVAVTPFIVWLLGYIHPIMSRLVRLIEKRYSAKPHTGIFERDDLLRLIEQQQKQDDSRLRVEELEIAKRALNFGDVVVGDIMTARKEVKTVLAEDTVGPVLIDELHKSESMYALVREKPKGPFVGTVEISKLGLYSTGLIKGTMHTSVYYLHESDSLSDALHAFFATNCPIFIVTNSFKEFVGIVTMENLLKQLLGHIPGDAFDQYVDISAVANRHPGKENPDPTI